MSRNHPVRAARSPIPATFRKCSIFASLRRFETGAGFFRRSILLAAFSRSATVAVAVAVAIAVCCGYPSVTLAEETVVQLDTTINPEQTFETEYQVQIEGQVIIPGVEGDQQLTLTSLGEFKFQQRQFANDHAGPHALRAIREFSKASTITKVGPDHITNVSLTPEYRTIHVFGTDNRLLLVSPDYLIPRKQLDLLQLPFDPLVLGSSLPGSAVKVGDKWNTDSWLLPVLTGVEVVIEQSTTCTLVSVTDDMAVITMVGKISGAAVGSASNVSFSGELRLDTKKGYIKSFVGQQKEKRIPGPVSPGLNVTANIRWTQALSNSVSSIEKTPDPKVPDNNRLMLVLQTPLKLQLHHSREWHLFHETPSVLMMRQLRDGHLISQCNLSSAVLVPPNGHTPDKEFLADVTESVSERKGNVISESTVRDDERWRIRRIQAVGDASGDVILWDYFLCSAKSGEQFSIVFSHSKSDEELFGDEANRMLSSLQIARPRGALPLR